MNVSIEKSGGCRLLVDVSVPADKVRPEYERVIKLYSKNARIPGFRPGKVPVALVETRFRKDIIKQTQDHLLPETYQEMLKKEELTPVAVVDVNNVVLSPESGLSFRVVLDVAPEFKLPKYHKISVAAAKADVSDADVEEALAQVRRRFARYEDLTEGCVQDQDMAKVTYSGACDGQPLSEVVTSAGELAAGVDFWLPMVNESEFLPGLNAALTGVEIGKTVTVNVDFPEDYRVKDLAGRNVVYTVTVNSLRRQSEPEMNEAFLKDLNVASVDELRKQIREGLEAEKKASEESRQKQEISKFLIENTKIEVPESQVASETTALLRSLLNRMAQSGGTREMLEKHRDEIMGSVTQQASDRVKLGYIGKAIAAAENITLTDEDVERELTTMAQHYRMPADKLRAEIEKQEDGMTQLRNDILHASVLNYLLGQAKIK